MLRVVSQGPLHAEVIVQDEVVGSYVTLHLEKSGSRWRDKWGTLYDLESGEVDWFLYYRDRLLSAIRNHTVSPAECYRLAVRLGHAIEGKEPEEEAA